MDRWALYSVRSGRKSQLASHIPLSFRFGGVVVSRVGSVAPAQGLVFGEESVSPLSGCECSVGAVVRRSSRGPNCEFSNLFKGNEMR